MDAEGSPDFGDAEAGLAQHPGRGKIVDVADGLRDAAIVLAFHPVENDEERLGHPSLAPRVWVKQEADVEPVGPALCLHEAADVVGRVLRREQPRQRVPLGRLTLASGDIVARDVEAGRWADGQKATGLWVRDGGVEGYSVGQTWGAEEELARPQAWNVHIDIPSRPPLDRDYLRLSPKTS